MSKNNAFKKKRSMSFHHPQDEDKKLKPCHVTKIKNTLFSKPRVFSNAYKKFSPFKDKKETWVTKRLRKALNKDIQPPTPHNTTQFIVDAVHYPTDPHLYEFDNNRFEYNFQHHAMAGSMMDLMQQRVNMIQQEIDQNRESSSMQLDGNDDREPKLDYDMPQLRAIRSADDVQDVTFNFEIPKSINYHHYLKDVENGKNLENVVKQLVQVIRKKDDQINSLLSETVFLSGN